MPVGAGLAQAQAVWGLTALRLPPLGHTSGAHTGYTHWGRVSPRIRQAAVVGGCCIGTQCSTGPCTQAQGPRPRKPSSLGRSGHTGQAQLAGTQPPAWLHDGERMELRQMVVGKLGSWVRDLEGTQNTENQVIHRGHQKSRTSRFLTCTFPEEYPLDVREEFLDQI
jgi:hypothetical protein